MCSSKYKLIFCILLFFCILISCHNKKKKQENYAKRIAQESCKEFSAISTGIVGTIVSGLASYMTDGNVQNLNTGSLGELPDKWCDCYCYFVTKDLSEKFTDKELLVIRKDKVKKFMVIGKIIEKRELDMKKCIEETTNEIVNDYGRFSKELDEKFK